LSHQFTEWLVARAAIVPSSPRRTFLVSLASLAAGLLGFVLLAERTARPGMGSFGRDLLWAGMWGAGALAIATLVSWVIYGLRKDVREARRLGQYLLEDKVGEGGMGTVYRARHALLKRPTAVKLLRPERMGAETIERFEREVQLTAGLSHPNTVSIFDYGRTADGVFYYAMEYLDGLDLESLVRADGPQPPARVASILSQVAAALGEAHAIGLVHRDIKPANIILCERGGVPDVAKVVDFGLVRELGTDAGQTNLQVLKGTPLYMAPEAFSAPETVDGRSDLYALGAVGYYLLAGRPVFEGRTIGEVCGHHLHTEPVPPSLRLGRPLPEALESIVMSCLRKDPSLRPTSAGDLRRALQRYGETDGWSEDDAREWWRAWNARDHGLNLTSSETPTFVLEPAGRF
jgi:serine/threonine-protein kinase